MALMLSQSIYFLSIEKMKKFTGDKILLVILILAFILRVWGIWWGLPLFLHLDEPTIISPALKMIQTGDLNPHYFRYPTLYIYFISVIILFSKMISWFLWMDDKVVMIYLLGRFSTAIISTITIYLVYWLGKFLFSKRVGYFASFTFSIMFLPLFLSHFITVDMLALLFLMLSLIFCFKIMQKGERMDYLLAGLFSGFLIGTKFNVVILAPLILSYFFVVKKNKRSPVSFLILSFLMLIFAFLMTNLYLILSFEEYLKGGISQVLLLRGQEVISMSDKNGISSWLWYLKYWVSSGIGLPLSLSLILGILLSIFKKPRCDKNKFLLFISFPIFYTLVIFLSHHRADRYSLPLMPFFAIFAGLFFMSGLEFFEKVFRSSKARLILSGLFLSIFFGLPIYKAIAFDYLISQKDTRQQASDWLKERYPKDQAVFTVGDTISIGHDLQAKGFGNVANLFPLKNKDIFLYSGEILLVDSTNYNIASNYRKIESYKNFWENYQLIRQKGELIKEFSQPLFKAEFFSPAFLEHSSTVNAYHNPTVQIYQVPKIANYFDKNIHFEYLPERIASNMSLVEVDGRKMLFSDGVNETGTSGPHEFFPAGDYLLTYFLENIRCPSAEKKIILRVTSSGGAREFARKEFSCHLAQNYDKFNLTFPLKKASRLELVLKVEKGVALLVEKAILTRQSY